MRDYWNKGCRCDVLDIASRRCLTQPRQSHFLCTSELHPIIIKVMTDSLKPSWQSSGIRGKTWRRKLDQRDAKKAWRETIWLVSLGTLCPQTIWSYYSLHTERQFDETKGVRSCLRCDHCVSEGNFYSVFHHQLVNLLPLQHLIEFILTKTGYRGSWMGQSILVKIQ